MLKPGELIIDLHATSLRSLALGGKFTVPYGRARMQRRAFYIRSVIDFVLPDADQLTDAVALSRHHLLDYFTQLCLSTTSLPYMNKYLVVLAEPNDEGWAPAGYIYDGRRAGFCEIKEAA